MVNKPKPYIISNIKDGLLKNKDYDEVLLENGYAESTSKQGKRNPVIKEALLQINTELSEQGLDTEGLIRGKKDKLNECVQEIKNAKSKDQKLKWMKLYNEISDSTLKFTVGEKHRVSTPAYSLEEKEQYKALRNRVFDVSKDSVSKS